VTVEAKVNPTEDRLKVLRAMHTTLAFEDKFVEEVIVDNEIFLRVSADGRQALRKLFTRFREQRTVEAARKLFYRHIKGNSTRVFFHKQGAFQGVLHFSMEEGESPLGPIMVEIVVDDIERVLNWLVPRTEDGTVIEADYAPD
jgi:predicted RNA binding protein with dsRBD fold (UPF0201 family)